MGKNKSTPFPNYMQQLTQHDKKRENYTDTMGCTFVLEIIVLWYKIQSFGSNLPLPPWPLMDCSPLFLFILLLFDVAQSYKV